MAAETVYAERALRFEDLYEIESRRWEQIANMRLAAFIVAVAGLAWGLWQGITPLWLMGALALCGFLLLARYHNLVGKSRRRYKELWQMNVEAADRVLRRWDALPVRHSIRAGEGAPYAHDLDIFGHASLFQLMETVGTTMGERTLGAWLQRPASPEVGMERQGAVAELAPQIDFREELALRGRLMGEQKPDPDPFLAWAEGDSWLANRRWLPLVARLSVALLWMLILLQAFGVVPYPLWVLFAGANILVSQTAGRHVYQILMRATAGESGFRHYAEAFELISLPDYSAPMLRRLQAQLLVQDLPAHGALRRLHRLTTLVLPRASQLYVPIQALTMWDVHLLGAFERWQASAGNHARRWLDVLGDVEALAGLSVLAHDNPAWAFPVLDPSATSLHARDLGHPLLASSVRVANDVTVGPQGTFLLVTGSNMSGKSTLLRAIGVNIVLAGAGGPVCSSSMRLPPVELWTSMRIEDSLERGVSYFMAELQRLKTIVEAARRCRESGEKKLFYLLDEILQGTNTAERQIAARRVIMYLVEQGALGAVSTHDLTIAEEPTVAAAARLVHFTETVSNDNGKPAMHFDYKLRPGIATSTNALRLMEIVGLDFGESE